nr:hypothetical protein [Variovorax boronicumulans]
MAAIVASAKGAGILTGDAARAGRYIEPGAACVTVGVDVSLLAQGMRRVAADFGLGANARPGNRFSY